MKYFLYYILFYIHIYKRCYICRCCGQKSQSFLHAPRSRMHRIAAARGALYMLLVRPCEQQGDDKPFGAHLYTSLGIIIKNKTHEFRKSSEKRGQKDFRKIWPKPQENRQVSELGRDTLVKSTEEFPSLGEKVKPRVPSFCLIPRPGTWINIKSPVSSGLFPRDSHWSCIYLLNYFI